DLGVFFGFAQDRQVGDLRVQLVDVGGAGDEVVFHHQQAIDRLVHTSGAQRVARQALGRADLRCLVAKHCANALDLGNVTDRSRGAVGVQVIDRGVDGGQ